MGLKAGFIFLGAGAEEKVHRSWIHTPSVELLTVGVADYEIAELVAREMEQLGIKALELCGGFGIEGVARIKKAVSKEVIVGVVRFDHHPGLNDQSGDEFF